MIEDGSPLGAPVDGPPAERPAGAGLDGRFGRLEKLHADRHADLWRAIRGHDDLWAYLGYGPFTADEFAGWLTERAALTDPFYYAIVDARGAAVGVATLMEIRPAMRVIEVGHILHSPALQRTSLATEAHYLLARHVFETLGYRRYEWKCNALNAPSRRAAERLGFSFEGLFRQHLIVKGRNRDTAWYSMLDREWPTTKAAFERWLDPSNFDALGRQRTSLTMTAHDAARA